MLGIGLLCMGAVLGGVPQDGPGDIVVGHWLEIRGDLEGRRFLGQKVEVLEPERYEVLIGTVEEETADRLVLLGQPVSFDPEGTSILEPLRAGGLAGRRVKLEGRWRNAGKFSAREIGPRGAGRDRIAGRADVVRPVEGGVEVEVMIFTVFLPDDVELEHAKPLAEMPLSEIRGSLNYDPAGEDRFDEDDLFGEGIRLTDNISVQGQLEARYGEERNFNLDDPAAEDRDDLGYAARTRFEWRAGRNVSGRVELRYDASFRDEQSAGYSRNRDTGIGEAYVYWRSAFGIRDLDLQVGRQDFDDAREWIYDENLDALRLIWDKPDLRTEVALSASLGDAGTRNDEAYNLSAYVSNNDEQKHLAAWALYRDINQVNRDDEEALHVGGRILGEWFEDHESWLDVALQVGQRGDRDVRAWGYDIGTTWSPERADPYYFTLGYALGSGDRSSTGTDGTFRQTGFQDNNGKWGGVTSFRLYGELLDPELSNLGIFTAGVGRRFWGRNSVDLVFHQFTQDVPLDNLTDANVEDPAGIRSDLGWEVDLILGIQRFDNWNIELVYAWFEPGDAFVSDEEAQFIKFQARYRF